MARKHKGGIGKGFHLDKGAWLIVGGLGGVALYLMLLGGYTGVKPLDASLHGVGNSLGIEGIGKDYLPDLLTSDEKQAMFADEDDDYGEMPVTVA